MGMMMSAVPRRCGWRLAANAAGLGCLAAAALPPMHLVPLLWIAVPGLLILLQVERSGWGAFKIGFWFGFGHHILGLYWITEAILIESARYWWLVPLAVPALAAVMAVFIATACMIARWFPTGWPRIVAFVGAWGITELARQFIATGFPWNPWGSVWAVPGAVGDVMLQPAAWVGVHGLTLLTLILAAIPLFGQRAIIGGLAVLAIWVAFGGWRLGRQVPDPPNLTVVLVQGNVPQGQKWDRHLMAAIFERYLTLTRNALSGTVGPVVVIWPETASPYLLDRDQVARAMFAEASLRVDGVAVPGLIGTVRFDLDRRPLNSLVVLQGAGPPVAIYDKSHLVPFGEYQPRWSPLPIEFGPGGFVPGPGPRTLRVVGLPAFSPSICYEVIFPGFVVDQSDRPQWMVTITNDAWFGNSAGPRQHLAAARMRAVEEGLPIMRAANTGITGGYDAFGRELGRIGMRETGTLSLALPGALPITPFGRFGLLIPVGSSLALLVAGLWGAITTRRLAFRDERRCVS
jgi:apolipoprotein N-acyltransferase